MVSVHDLFSNLSKMTVSNDHHKIDIDGKLYKVELSTQVNVKEDQHEQMIVGHKTSHLTIFIQWARTKLHNFEIHGRNQISDQPKDQYIQLCDAATKGDWRAAEDIEKEHKGILSEVINKDREETALHIATRFNQPAFVEKLIEKLSKENLEATNKYLKAKNIYGNTALCIAATSGDVDIARFMVQKQNDLVLIPGSGNATPVLIAARYKHNRMVSYFLEMEWIIKQMEINQQMELLFSAIATDHYDIALLILKWNESLALKRDVNDDTPLHIMARKSNIIHTKNNPTKWQSSIHGCCKPICKKKMMQIQAHKTLEQMWSVVQEEIGEDKIRDFILHPSSMLHDAARVGNVEFVRVLLHKNSKLLQTVDGSGKNIFHIAVENRQRSVFNLIYDMKLFNPDDLLYHFNEENISLLELAAKRADPGHLDRVSGAVFQMHQELLWFKDVENILERTMRIKKGKRTTRELFIQEHKELVKEAEKWVKSTANSCMLVATLIATVVFAAAFTVPGGNDENNGSPMFLSHKWFTVFVVSDAIALISSSTSILLFLSILTSRCAETDFLFWLPLELVLGLGFLFLSVLGMVLAFSACFFLHYGKHISCIPLLITGMAIVPVYWFCVLQWKLWADALAALHASGMSCLLKGVPFLPSPHALEVQQPQVNGNDNQNQTLIHKTRLKSKIQSFTDPLIRRVKSILHIVIGRVESILHNGRSLSEGNGSGVNDVHCRLRKAATNGDWETAEKLEMGNPGILSAIISEDRNETALHIATRFNQVGFVQKLVAKLSVKDLRIQNSYGNTALCIAATLGGLDIAKSMVEKHKDLIGEHRNVTPVLIAARYKHNDMVSYLLDQKDSIASEMELELLVGAISANHYDIALIILKGKDWLATERNINQDTLLHIMARKPNTIASYKMTTKWESCIEKSLFKCLCKKTTMEIKAHQMVANMWSIVKKSANSKEILMNFIKHPSSMLHDAARVGNVEFLEVLLNSNPDLLRIIDDDGKSIFHVAVENRQEGVFNLIYDMKLFNPDDLLYYFDEEKISLLELAAKSANPKHLDRVSGAVFQMHSELLWFKVVENIVELTTRLNRRGGETAREIFTREHKELKEEGEKWVKRTANSCMLVATLIATVVFAAAFTVPGGQNESSGLPIFVDKKWFTVFVISDGIALVSSSTAILLFLSILTSRCAENDFLFWLPLELVGGLGSLFVSVLCMVLAFGAVFFLYYGKDTALLPLMITGMAAVPIFWFCVLQWKLWAHALVSLHASTVFCLLRTRKTSILKAITNGVFVR